jgi:hypothetical protein
MSLFKELKRRNVFRVGIAYTVASWLLIQVTDIVFPRIGLPDSAVMLVIALLAIGFIPALILAWAFELTPEGIKLEKHVDRSKSINQHTGHQLNRGIIMILSMAIVLLLTDRFRDEIFGESEPGDVKTENTNKASNEPQPIDSKKSIAVLPFRDMSANQDQAYFGEGITEELLNALVKIKGLDVASRTSSLTKSLEAADQALKIHPQSTEALLIKADYSESHCDISEAAHLYQKAIAFNPQDPTAQHWYAMLLERAGRISLALEHIQMARRIDPLISAVISVEAGIYRTMGDYTRADELYRMASRLGIYGGSLYPVGLNYLSAGEIQKGKALIEEGWIGEEPTMPASRELFLQALTDPDKQGAFEKHIGIADESQPFNTADNIELLSMLGSPYVFEYSSELECPVLSPAIWVESFRAQRKTPEFFKLMERAGLVDYWREFGWPDDCASLDQNLAECP